jgi:CRP/FNR family transcriptional regulator, anaerobic regulatory protein
VFGLAEAGHYVNSLQTITPVRMYELDVDTLTGLFMRDADLELQFLCKTVHILRESQHHNIIVGRRDAAGRLAMLLAVLLRQNERPHAQCEVAIPMTRSDIANYLGLSLESVVRASSRLERQGIVEFVDRHHARILDRRRFEALASNV